MPLSIDSVYPKDVNIVRLAVPFSVMTAVTTVDTEVAEITVANTTSGTITITVQDTQASPKQLFNVVNVDPNQPVSLQLSPAELMKGGLQWQASATGLVGTIRGRQLLALSLGAASSQTNNQPVPV